MTRTGRPWASQPDGSGPQALAVQAGTVFDAALTGAATAARAGGSLHAAVGDAATGEPAGEATESAAARPAINPAESTALTATIEIHPRMTSPRGFAVVDGGF